MCCTAGEADLVAIHVESLIQSGVNAADIAVISPYNFQVTMARVVIVYSRYSNTWPPVW